MAKPPRRKVPTPNTNTTGEAYVDDTELEDGADNVEDTITEGFSEEDSEDETEAETGVTFNYPTMEEMDVEEDEDTDTEAGVHFVGSTPKKDTPDALVKVRISCHKQFVVGGERYDMYPGKTYLVPKNVKDVLRENDLLRPL